MNDMIKHIKEDIETFIKSGTSNAWPERAVLLVNDEVHYSTRPKHAETTRPKHAEMNAVPSIFELLQANKEIDMYINYSPCGYCANQIATMLQDNPHVPVRIKYACLYKPKKHANRNGLMQLMSGSNTTLETIHGDDWITVIQRILESHGKTYRKTILKQILEEYSTQEEVLQEILKCHGADYWKAKSLQTSVVALDDGEEKWEEDLKAILLENWEQEMEQKLREILKHHGEDQWPTVLAMIRKHQGKDGWQTTPTQLLQTREVDAGEETTEILCPSERDCLRALSMEKPGDHRQGYVWLKVVLAALDIEVREEWLGQRIRTDTYAAKELKDIEQENF